MAPIRLLVVDDHPVFRQGLRDVLSTDSEIVVVGEAADGKEALEQAYALQPDVILMDINLPGNSGLQATSQLLESLPEIRVRLSHSFARYMPSMKAWL
jgi:DNA-binding NarL/FixJ family response regulator